MGATTKNLAAIRNEIMLNGFRMGYENEYEFYTRVIKALMSMCPPKAYLDPKTICVLALMCIIASRGGNITDSEEIWQEMSKHKIKKVSDGTLRNYRVVMRRGGWLTKEGLNGLLQQTIAKKGLAFGIFNETKQ